MRTNHQGQRRHLFIRASGDISSASTGRRHDRARDVHNSFKATLDHGAPSRHDRYLRGADGWCRREADITDRDDGRRSWADRAPRGVASGTVGMCAKAVIPSRARNSLHAEVDFKLYDARRPSAPSGRLRVILFLDYVLGRRD